MRQLQTQLPSWKLASEQIGAGLLAVGSNSDTLVGDRRGIDVTRGGNDNGLPRADQFAQSETSLSDERKNVYFYGQYLTIDNAEWMESMGKETLMKPTQITSALTIHTPAGNAIVSLTNTQSTRTTSSNTCALWRVRS